MEKKGKTLRYPVVSGLFYPDGKEELDRSIESYLQEIDRDSLYTKVSEQTGIKEPKNYGPLVLISPHAGYIFSGRVQAHSYILLEKGNIDTIIIIGPTHQEKLKGISVNLDDAYETPMGLIEVDLEFANKLISGSSIFQSSEEAHLREHVIEVQLPFIQKLFPNAKIVSLLFGEQNWDNARLLKDSLINTIKDLPKRYLIVVSSDLSHYHSSVDALMLDNTLIEDVKNMAPESFYKNIESGNSEACGFGCILTGIMIANEIGMGKSAILQYMNSGEVSGDRKRVVGYLSAALY